MGTNTKSHSEQHQSNPWVSKATENAVRASKLFFDHFLDCDGRVTILQNKQLQDRQSKHSEDAAVSLHLQIICNQISSQQYKSTVAYKANLVPTKNYR
jgi:hypothetical protein